MNKIKTFTFEAPKFNNIRFYSFDKTSLEFADINVEIMFDNNLSYLNFNMMHEINSSLVNLNVLDYGFNENVYKIEVLMKSDTYDLDNIGVDAYYLELTN